MESTIKSLMADAEMLSTIVADAILKRTAPVQDDISERQAREAYGTTWLRRAKEAGLVKATREGNRVIYSRHQLDCLRAAERMKEATLVFRKRINNTHTHERKN